MPENDPTVVTIKRGDAKVSYITELIEAIERVAADCDTEFQAVIRYKDGSKAVASAKSIGWQSLEWDQITIEL